MTCNALSLYSDEYPGHDIVEHSPQPWTPSEVIASTMITSRTDSVPKLVRKGRTRGIASRWTRRSSRAITSPVHIRRYSSL